MSERAFRFGWGATAAMRCMTRNAARHLLYVPGRPRRGHRRRGPRRHRRLRRRDATAQSGPRPRRPSPRRRPARLAAAAPNVAEIYKKVSPGVVSSPSPAPRARPPAPGFVIDDEGHIVTNDHVVEGADKFRVRFGENGDADRRQAARRRPVGRPRAAEGRPGKVVGDELQPLELGASEDLRPGDPAIAIGSPFGLEGTVTERHRLRARPHDPGPQRLLDLRRHPDRRRDQPRQLGRPAARRAGPRDRRQLADRAPTAATPTPASASRSRSTTIKTLAARARARRGDRARVPRRLQRRQRRRGRRAWSARSSERPGRRAPACARATGSSRSTDQPVRDPDDVSAVVNARRPGDKVRVVVERDGERRTLTVTLGDAARERRTTPEPDQRAHERRQTDVTPDERRLRALERDEDPRPAREAHDALETGAVRDQAGDRRPGGDARARARGAARRRPRAARGRARASPRR